MKLSRKGDRLWVNNYSTGGHWLNMVHAGYRLHGWLKDGEKTIYEFSFMLANVVDSVEVQDYLNENSSEVFASDADDNTDFCQMIFGMPVGAVMETIWPKKGIL